MIAPEVPADEPQRVAALHELGILDTEAEERFDRLTRLAQGAFNVPIALVSLVDSDRQWFKSRQGLDATQTPREVSFCGHAILQDEVLVVEDATKDSRFADNPLVAGSPDIRFYAGAPLTTDDGYSVGTLCVIDTKPREWSPAQSQVLRDLAHLVEQEVGQSRLRSQQRALMALTAVTALSGQVPSELLRSALAIGAGYLDMPAAVVLRIEDEKARVLAQIGPEELVAGCGNLAPARVVTSIIAIPAVPDSAAPEAEDLELCGCQSYLGVPIDVEGVFSGTLAFLSGKPRPGGRFAGAEIDFVTFLGRWLAITLRRSQLNEQIEEQQRIADLITRAQTAFISIEDRRTAFEGILQDLLVLTGSEFGLIGETLKRPDGAPYMRTHALSDIAWNTSTRDWYDQYRDTGLEFDNAETLFGRTLFEGQAVVSNDAAADPSRSHLPQGHPLLQSYLGLPVTHGGQMVGMVGLANKPGGYSEADIRLLDPVLVTVGQLLLAWKSMRERLEDQKSIDRLSTVVRQMTSGVIITTLDGRIQWANEAFVKLMGYPIEDVLGRRPRQLLHGPGTSRATEQAIFEAMDKREPFQFELLAYRGDGQGIWVELESNPLVGRNGEHEGFMVMVSDIEERKRTDEMKSEFVSTVSHELRTPLTSITGALKLVSSGVVGDVAPQAMDLVVIAEKNSQRLSHLIDDLLDMEKLVEGKVRFTWSLCEVMPIIDRTVDENRSFGESMNVTYDIVERCDGVVVDVDALRLQQVLTNLLSNAAKFSDEGKRVEVRVREVGSRVRVEVQDHGEGIDPKFQARIFQKFSQADSSDTRARGGTGLGLAISRELIERMHGVIGFTSTPGHGSMFYFELPMASAPDYSASTDTSLGG